MADTTADYRLDLTYPDADDLTTIGDGTDSARATHVYLDPATLSLYVGQGDGTPIRAWHGEHARVCRVPPEADGESVLAALSACEDQIHALAETYEGSYWDGYNRRGRWSSARHDRAAELSWALDRALAPVEEGGYLRTAWDAGDWLAGARPTWASLCADAGVDPERRDDDAVRAVVDHLDEIADADGVIVSRTESAVRAYLERRSALDD
jgi:hypothetical protein